MLTTDPCTQMAAYLTAPKEEGDEMIGVVRPRTSQLEVVTWLEYGDGVVCVLWLRLRHEGASTPSGPAACTASSPTLSFFFYIRETFVSELCAVRLCWSFVMCECDSGVWNGNFRGTGKQDESCGKAQQCV